MENFLKKLSNSVVQIFDENGNEIFFTKKEVKLHLFKYSSTHKEKVTLFIDDTPISSSKKYKITYRCDCGALSTILLEKFVLKTKLTCKKCVENEDKRRWHGEVIRKIHRGESYVKRNSTKQLRKYDFNSESDSFKEEFYKNYLTIDEFIKCKQYIYSIHDIVLGNKEVFFLEHENGVNFKKYRQMVMIDGKKIPFQKIKLKCPLCGSIFSISRPIKERVKKNNFDCRSCFFNNKVFNRKKYEEGLTYQSNFEFQFIELCKKHNIEIKDGIKVHYYFDNAKREYTTDFLLPNLGFVIELKDNHIWHKKQLESGRWEKKENAAITYCNQNNLKYIMLFPEDIDNFFKKYCEIDSLNFRET